MHGLHDILIPGFGYGRNAKIFHDSGFAVTGIEISETAIDIARKYFRENMKIYHGSVSSMPFDQKLYDGIFSYSLIHLLNADERKKLIDGCYNQLKPGGYMVFVSISKSDFRYGKGEEVSKDTFAPWSNMTLFFYERATIESDFSNYGLIEAFEISEPVEDVSDKPAQKFWYIVCKK